MVSVDKLYPVSRELCGSDGSATTNTVLDIENVMEKVHSHGNQDKAL